MRIFENQTAQDFAVLNADSEPCVKMGETSKAPVYWFSRLKEVGRGAFVSNGRIFWRAADTESEIMLVEEISLKGMHNLENVLAGVAIGMLAGVDAAKIRTAVGNFKAVEHRLEYVATVRSVDYFNDSKATNVDATIKALESFPGGIHLILGGKDKGSDYSVLNTLLSERVKRVYTIGAAAAKIESQVRGTDVMNAGTLENAVKRASESATPGDVVLLAPACASFDQFDSYEHRGRVFKDLVRQLAARERDHEQVGSGTRGGQA
jgi:UDP-N-acetylmuramoylalanine--D-glutamate ligase